MKNILVIFDGGADVPIGVLGNKTPFESAHTPHLDYFAREGRMGYLYPLKERIIPSSDAALFQLFGNDYRQCRRGVFEALGVGFSLHTGDLAVRTNFATIENMKSKKVIDRRVGRTLTEAESLELARSINEYVKLPCEFEFRSSVQHRGVLVLRGHFSDAISTIDNEWAGKKSEHFLFSQPLVSNPVAQKTSEIINSFVEQSSRILQSHPINQIREKKGLFPANMIFTRGAGIQVPRMKQYKKWLSIQSMPLEIGLSSAMGMKVFPYPYPHMKGIDAYDALHRALKGYSVYSQKIIQKHFIDYQGVYIHFKECDNPGHDNKPYEKKNMFEAIDKDFFGFLRNYIGGKSIRLVVTCDHATPCRLKGHSAHPVPVLVYDGKHTDDTVAFSEKESQKGSLGKIYGHEFLKKTGLR